MRGLTGLISKLDILTLEFANKLHVQEGIGPREAIETCRLRAAAPGPHDHGGHDVLVPLIAAEGVGAKSRFAIGSSSRRG